MQTKSKDNRNLEENSQPPILPTPHFNSKRIAAAKPVEFLPDDFGQKQNRRLPQILIGALVGLALVATIGLGLGLVLLNRAQLQPADDASVSIDRPATEATAPATTFAAFRKEAAVREDAPRSRLRCKPESLRPVMRITEQRWKVRPRHAWLR